VRIEIVLMMWLSVLWVKCSDVQMMCYKCDMSIILTLMSNNAHS